LQPWEMMIGDISSWISAVLYLLSRIPQIVLNYRRRTVKGLSMSMFFMMCAANTFYGTSILLLSPPIDTRFYASVLPFFVGVVGHIGGEWGGDLSVVVL